MTTTQITTDVGTVRTALYQRVSTGDQALPRQYEENLAAARHGRQVTEYEDPGESASRFAGRHGGTNRKGWGRLLADRPGCRAHRRAGAVGAFPW
jgi:resolvase-like protein